ncbi:Hypothetical predicted protein [Paramuricea clavata]|uniref:Uncharacterized protein n=1 Tax=Paramuricea clavata TaxID=317549 RepID=A0A7D9HDM6_PARCT|nr:Hypothetical predicted protein [Paramuricea clavata]
MDGVRVRLMFVFDAWDMDHAEAVSKRLFFEIAKADVGNVFKTSITKDFKEGFVVNSYDKVVTAQYKEASFVECVYHCKGLAFDGSISGFGGVGKTASDQGNFPASFTAERPLSRAVAVILK